MDTNQPTPPPTPPVYAASASSPGVFGTKIPSSVAFAIAILLFFLPFIDIKCNNMSLQQVSGFQLATGFQMKNKSSDSPLFNDFKSNEADQQITKSTTGTDKKDPNLFAMVALGLGVLGLLLSFTKAKASLGLSMFTGILAVAAMIGLMIDIKKKVKIDMPGSGRQSSGDDVLGLNKLGQEVGDKMNISVDFTLWFYVAIIAFLAAAFFCYKRMQVAK
jgi:hypothetical protein